MTAKAGVANARTLRAAADRHEPALWVRRLVVLDELSPDAAHVIREVQLRRGLNILWAQPVSSTTPRELFTGETTGHDAGKTTFCRFTRHILGEPSFGTKALRERLRERMPNGWIIGEVTVGGENWVVGRPIAVGPHPFAVRAESYVDAVVESRRGRYADFLDAIERTLIAPLPVRTLPQSGHAFGWLQLLPWLTRDQESRFASLWEWRASASESESPETSSDDRHAILRLVMGLLTDEEATEQQNATGILSRAQALEEKVPFLQSQALVDWTRLTTALGLPANNILLGDLLVYGKATSRLSELNDAIQAAHAGVDEDAQRELLAATGELSALAERVRMLEANEKSELDVIEGRTLPGLTVIQSYYAQTSLQAGACAVPLARMKEIGCPAAPEKIPRSLTDHRDDAGTKPWIDAARERLVGVREQLREANAKRSATETRHRLATERVRELKAVRPDIDRLTRAKTEIETLRDRAASSISETEKAADRLATLRSENERSLGKQHLLRVRHAARIRELTGFLDFVAQALLGTRTHASLTEYGRELRVTLSNRGELGGAAMTTLRLLCFDLGTLAASISGVGMHPRFLLHDGPREADMDPGLYERLFLFASLMEDAYEGPPGFQYVITTTTAPPENARIGSRILEPVLDASRAEGRFLKMDL